MSSDTDLINVIVVTIRYYIYSNK